MKQTNSNILKTTYVFIGLFTFLVVHLLVYIFTAAKEDINNSYNKRRELYEEKIVRGTIYANDMTVLAETVKNEDGTETRVYPYDELFCHVVGSVEKGRYGLESAYNFDMLDSEASIIEEVVAEFNNQKLAGNSIVTTLDIELQDACHEALGDYDGAVMIMNASSGDVLSMVSKPDYNPNDIVEIWEEIRDDENGILLNRATQGLYPPGSVFKMLTLEEYIDAHRGTYSKYEFECEGTVDFTDFTMSCSNKKAHGKMDLMGAFANSCNCTFVNMGLYIDSDKFRESCQQKLFNSELPLELPHVESIFSLTSYDNDFMKSQTVIGQGETLVTPIHMCLIMSSIANDGILMKPRFVTEIIDSAGKTVEAFKVQEYEQLYSTEDAELLKEYLTEVVETGTAYRLNSDTAHVYGKTGTAQISTTGMADSWFVGAVETKDGEVYSFVVLLENINENTSPAVVVAKEILKSLDK